MDVCISVWNTFTAQLQYVICYIFGIYVNVFICMRVPVSIVKHLFKVFIIIVFVLSTMPSDNFS